MDRRGLATSLLGLVAIVAPSLWTAASADVVNLYNFNVTLNGPTAFTDNFTTGTLNGGSCTVLPAGPSYSDGTTALYQVIGKVTEAGAPPTLLDTAQGALLTQSPPFLPWSVATSSRCLPVRQVQGSRTFR